MRTLISTNFGAMTFLARASSRTIAMLCCTACHGTTGGGPPPGSDQQLWRTPVGGRGVFPLAQNPRETALPLLSSALLPPPLAPPCLDLLHLSRASGRASAAGLAAACSPQQVAPPGIMQRSAIAIAAPTTWTVLQKNGPNHLGLWYNMLPWHQMAPVTSDCLAANARGRRRWRSWSGAGSTASSRSTSSSKRPDLPPSKFCLAVLFFLTHCLRSKAAATAADAAADAAAAPARGLGHTGLAAPPPPLSAERVLAAVCHI